MIDLRGNTEKAIIAGGTVNLLSGTVVEEYVNVAAGTVNNDGTIQKKLTVRAGTFQNNGSAGEVDYQSTDLQRFGLLVTGILGILQLLVVIGFMVLGIVLLKFFPRQFLKVESTLFTSKIKNTIVGFSLIIVVAIISVLLMITIIGLPIAIVITLSFSISLLISSLFVSLSLGKKIADLININANDTWLFILGFIILNILYIIPIAGPIITIITVSLGFGAIFYTLKKNWKKLTQKEDKKIK